MPSTSYIKTKFIPPSAIPYIELARLSYFLGPNVVVWPSVWAATFVATQMQLDLLNYIKLITVVHLIAGLLLHSIGSTWNDIVDRELDSQVDRTKYRPLPSGRVTLTQAFYFLLPQVIIMAAVLVRTSFIAFSLGIFSLLFLVPLYPFMKRLTYWPQAWLGFTFSWNIFVVSAMLVNDIQFGLFFPMFIGSICWCIHYDTIYGMMDIEDDKRIGIKSTAILFGNYARPVLTIFSAVFVLSLWFMGKVISASTGYYMISVFLTSVHLLWQLVVVDFDNITSCSKIFFSNSNTVGYLVWFGLLLEYLH
ncbi:UbiA prenyltransferase family [Cyathus striatus]|nr:UbiA prenyltransferase family [Cyathus striatus]